MNIKHIIKNSTFAIFQLRYTMPNLILVFRDYFGHFNCESD